MIALLCALAFAQDPGTLTRPPAVAAFVEATHPPEEAGRTGSVVLALTIDATGRVELAEVVESAGPAFDAAAVQAMQASTFTPAEIDGVPSRIHILYRYDFVERLELPTTAIFEGVVRDRERKVPLPGIRVQLGDRSVITDAEGRFRFDDVPAGAGEVLLEGERLTALSTQETFVAGERLATTYDVFLADPDEVADDMEILVIAPTIRRQAVSTELGAEEARKVPGTQGDVLRVVENLPGVARASLGTGALVVWGAAPGDTGVYVDGVRVPRLYHDGGLRSVVGSDLVRSVELVPGGYGASYGRGLGGLVVVRTDDLAKLEGVHGALAADLYDGSASVRARLGERVTVAAGGRGSWVGELLGAVAPEVGDSFPLPRYADGQARAGVELGDAGAVRVTVLGSTDRTTRVAPSADPAREVSDDRSLAFHRVIAAWDRDREDGSRSGATVSFGEDRAADTASYGPVQTSVVRRTVVSAVRAFHRARVLPALTVEGGLDGELRRSDIARAGSLGLPPREGDQRVFGQPPPDQITQDTTQVTEISAAPYVEGDLRALDDRLGVVAGLRLDPYARSVALAGPKIADGPTRGLFTQTLRAEPRLAVRAEVVRQLALTAAVGVYGQGPDPADLSASFGNPALEIARGRHAVVGVALQPVERARIEVTGFATTSRGLAMRNPVEQPARAQALLGVGRGRSHGAQVLARLEPGEAGAYGWISYTLSWSERQDAPAEAWRPSDVDQRHALTALGGLELPFGFEVALRGRVATGAPRSELVGALWDSRRDVFQPVFGEHNGIRLPTFFQLDARIARTFVLRATELELALEVQNATAHRNVEEFVYSPDLRERGGIRGLPILPVLGARWTF